MSPQRNIIKHKLHVIINEADTPMGRGFDILLLLFIILSVLVVMLDSVVPIRLQYGHLFDIAEWVFTSFFTIEYLLRIYITPKPFKNYIFTFLGIIDLLAVVPAYFGLMLGTGNHFMMVVRVFRLIKVFRVLKLAPFVKATNMLKISLLASRYKIIVFFGVVMSVVIFMGAMMYVVEGPENGFTSIPRAIYWAIVTLTTVGYGDISPSTALGQFIASSIMILGYSIIAVPTGLVSTEIHRYGGQEQAVQLNTQVCEHCGCEKHDDDAEYCKRCGMLLDE